MACSRRWSARCYAAGRAGPRCCVKLCDSKSECAKLFLWREVADDLIHMCYEREWYRKCGGCVGIRVLVKKLGVAWAGPLQVELMRCLMFVLSDSPAEFAALPVKEASDALGGTHTE